MCGGSYFQFGPCLTQHIVHFVDLGLHNLTLGVFVLSGGNCAFQGLFACPFELVPFFSCDAQNFLHACVIPLQLAHNCLVTN
jgi:hypothetical protein